MRACTLILLILTVSGPVAGQELGTDRPDKAVARITPPPPDPVRLRQGGDTILDAVEIDIDWYEGSGTTTGYTNDYDEVCPYAGSTSPDVVYTFVPYYDWHYTFDLQGSQYDTKVYIYDEDLSLVACNDDHYADYTSLLTDVWLVGGVRHYLVIDGYGGDHGTYQLAIWGGVYPPVWCPPDGVPEDEPPLTAAYVDAHNGGCNSLADLGYAPFQVLESRVFCGVSGWYLAADGSPRRDTDWFTLTLPPSGAITFSEPLAEYQSYLFELAPQDCDQVGVVQNLLFGPGFLSEMTVSGEPGSLVWLWVGPTVFESPGGYDQEEYDYVLYLDMPVAVADRSWSSVKALFR